MFKLSVLDQSMSHGRNQGAKALQETLAMAQWCESLGYERFWVSEHHAFPSVAGAAPEVLLAAIGAATNTIRLGSGGIMLPHYSPYKIAEVFSVLSNLYPSRIDLGVGRAPGADMETAKALATDGRPKFEAFPKLVEKLSEYLWQENTQPLVCPKPSEDIPLWMLGSSPDSAQLAAQRGLPYNLAAFINPQVQANYMSHYRNHFKASALCREPYSMLTISAFCADTQEKAQELARAFDINFYRFVTGQTQGSFLTPEEAALYPITPQLADFMKSRSALRVVGTQDQVKEKITNIAQQYQLDEIMIVSNMYYLEDRKRSFELIKAAFT
ncbi:MAG: LLM class flavin-dependent oxidoreductase [Bermanella sp.]